MLCIHAMTSLPKAAGKEKVERVQRTAGSTVFEDTHEPEAFMFDPQWTPEEKDIGAMGSNDTGFKVTSHNWPKFHSTKREHNSVSANVSFLLEQLLRI